MKRSSPRKLSLSREHLRKLSSDELGAAAGGLSKQPCAPTLETCTTVQTALCTHVCPTNGCPPNA